MAWDKDIITLDSGQTVSAQAPVIISASRSTDIPGFYSDWFLNRLKKGYSAWTNPFNGVKNYVSYGRTRLIVFWSKNPESLLQPDGLLDYLREKGINCYVQYTLNDYEAEGLEKGVPPLKKRIATFKALANRIGVGKVIWRFDPLILTESINVDILLKKVQYIGDELQGYTKKLVFSYADIAAYRKVKANLELNRVHYKEFSDSEMLQFAEGLHRLNENWGYALATCGERVDLSRFGVEHNKCVDDDLMIEYFSEDKVLMDFLGVEIQDADLFSGERTIIKKKNNKDKGQRQFCGCIVSKDIGEYNTCAHLCEYCYANSSKELAIQNLRTHKNNPLADTITGK